MDNLKPEENRVEGSAKEESSCFLTSKDFKQRNLKIDRRWTGVQALMAVAEVAKQKYVEEEEKKEELVSEHAVCSLTKPIDICNEEVLKREKALKKPMREEDDSMIEADDSRKAVQSPQQEKLMSSAFLKNSDYTVELNCKSEYTKKMKKTTSCRSHKSDSQNRSRRRQTGAVQIPDLPESFQNLIESLNGTDVRFIIQKKLYESDLNGNSRMSIPDKQVRQQFLYENEIQWLSKRRLPLKVFIEPSLDIFHGMELFRWELTKTDKPSTYQNVLVNKWTEVRMRNGLKLGDEVRVWSFRIEQQLCMALVRLTKPDNSADVNI